MAYNLKFDVEGDILRVTATGQRTFENVLTMAQEIRAACVEKDRKKVLIDVRDLEGRLSEMGEYLVPAEHFPKIRDRSVITTCAIVDRGEDRDRDKFFENVAVNRGFNLQIFSDPDAAVAWLRT